MIHERLVISDTNILLDLISVDMLEDFFSLPCDFSTTDFVISEIIQPAQIKAIEKYTKSKKLDIVSFSFEEIIEITDIHSNNTNNASITDCSVWYYAKTNNYILLTGDGKLRKSSLLEGVEVHGIIYVFDELVESGILQKTTAVERLKELWKSNPRLPKEEIEKRINVWTVSKKGEEPMKQ